jgi:hypothetical protein
MVGPVHPVTDHRMNYSSDDPLTALLVGGDMPLVRLKFEANVRAAAIGGAIYVAAIGPKAEDIVGASLWFGPGQLSMLTYVLNRQCRDQCS